ncbi:MAG: ATPase [Caulobacteraceae bacterium]|nr:ATPase [Caulobacteraceae bacterium]
MTDEIALETELEAAPEKVWRALEDPVLRRAWLAPDETAPEQGGPIDCEVIEADPPIRLRVAWRGRDLDTQVEFTVTPSEAGSRLRIVHSGLGRVRRASGSVMKMAA